MGAFACTRVVCRGEVQLAEKNNADTLRSLRHQDAGNGSVFIHRSQKNFQLHQQARPGRPETAPRCSLFVLCMCFSPAARIVGLWHMRSRRLAQGNHTCENAEFVGPMCRRRFWLKLGITFPGVCRWGEGAHGGCERWEWILLARSTHVPWGVNRRCCYSLGQ